MGDSGEKETIQLNGGEGNIRENLWQFLECQKARPDLRQNLVWIDALCINQADIHERNHQVSLMELIYKKADSVIVWLGVSSETSDLAMNYISTIHLKPLVPERSGFIEIWTREEGKAIMELCYRRYWSRIWIIQEIVLAKDITVLCGNRSSCWLRFESLWTNLKTIDLKGSLTRHDYATSVFASPASKLIWRRASWRHQCPALPPLKDLLVQFRALQCTDRRDAIFALLGLARNGRGIIVDYHKSVAELFTEVVAPERNNQDTGFLKALQQVLGVAYFCI